MSNTPQRFRIGFAAAVVVAAAASVSPAQEARAPADETETMMTAWEAAMTPGTEHALLASREGVWQMTMTIFGPPGSPPEISSGTVERRMDLGGRILVDHLTAEMMGLTLHGIATTGYDNVLGRYWTTWTDNVSTSLSMLWGDLTEDGGIWEGSYTEPMSGNRQPMRIDTRMEGPDRQIDTFLMPGPGGEMVTSMEVLYERK